MNIIVFGAAGFIGTNLALDLLKDESAQITLVDTKKEFFVCKEYKQHQNVKIIESKFDQTTDFETLLLGQDIVYHLVSTSIPTTSNQQIAAELTANVVVSALMLDACVKCKVKKVVFVSSGGTVYGKEVACPLSESTPTYPITSYGIQKVTIERLLYLYRYMYGLDYRIIRLANPYGPYQRPNGMLGAVTTFTYKALKGEEILVYGDGSVVRDFIYIDDAIRAMRKIAYGEDKHRTFNLGCGYGTSIKELLEIIEKTLGIKLKITYRPGRKVDVPTNYLNMSRYEEAYGRLNTISLEEGICKTANYLRKNMKV